MHFFVEPENDSLSVFFEKAVIQNLMLFNFKNNFYIFNTEETNTLIIYMYYM